MADRFPLIANPSTSTIQEIPSGDTLDLTGNNIKGAGIITATTFSGNLTGSVTGNAGGLTGTPNVVVGTLGCGNVTSTGDITGVNATFSGNLTVQGTTTTIDTAITAVDSLAVDGSVAIGTDSPSASHNLTVRGSNDTTFTNNPSNIFVAGIDTSGSGNSGAGINFGGRYRDDNGNTTAFAVVSGIKENTTHNNWAGALTFATRENGNAGGNQERLRITSDGRLLLGTTDAGGNNTANHLVVSNNAGANDQAGMTIRGGTSGRSQIFFSDGNSGQDEYRGMLRYDHQDNSMQFRTNATEKLRIDTSGHILPGADNTQDLGSSSKRFANIYTGDLNLSNEGSANDVDGTWGQYTIQEGEDDLFLINRRTGKKYKFNLTEVN